MSLADVATLPEAAGRRIACKTPATSPGRTPCGTAVRRPAPHGTGNALGAPSPAAPSCLLVVGDGSTSRLGGLELQAAFGLTPAEARLARLLADGNPLREAARDLNITYETARAYLKVVFGKTAVHTQAQLVALILRGAPGTQVSR